MLQVLRETGCDYDLFVMRITELVKATMGEEYDVRIYKVLKNNSLELDSLVILKEGKKASPNIYLLPYYESYLEGIEIRKLANRICASYQSYMADFCAPDFSYTFEDIKSKIIFRLVNYEKNKKLLENIPHIKYLDLAITFHCLVQNSGSGIGTIRITNEHMKLWSICLTELKDYAVNNTKHEFPPIIRSMEEAILDMQRAEHEDQMQHKMTDGEHAEQMQYETTEGIFCHTSRHQIYILSNSIGVNGATCLIYNSILKDFSSKLKTDLYILPSSIHEVILLPFHKSLSKRTLTEMVYHVNRTQVAEDEVLSDKVYYYSREKNAILL